MSLAVRTAFLTSSLRLISVILVFVVALLLCTRADASEPNWSEKLQTGIWTAIHLMTAEDSVTFSLQKHAGSAFDSRRGRIFLFGSDTHGEDWSNGPLIFDLASLSWRRLYSDDLSSSYRVNEAGLPVAGPDGDHPWAMHSFGAVDYHAGWDAVVVSSHPAHMEPGRFSTALAVPWPEVRRHPTWLFDLEQERWFPLSQAQTSFFAYATTYDSDREVMIGTGYHGIFELSGRASKWQKTADGSAIGYHNNAVYDPYKKALVVFGRNGLGNDVLVYRTDEAKVIAMPTPGPRPPKDEHAPMAFHPLLKESLVIVDRFAPGTSRQNRAAGKAETWAYDIKKDSWRRIAEATLPFALGMNYHLHYDPQRNLLLLVTAKPQAPSEKGMALPEVWALRL